MTNPIPSILTSLEELDDLDRLVLSVASMPSLNKMEKRIQLYEHLRSWLEESPVVKNTGIIDSLIIPV